MFEIHFYSSWFFQQSCSVSQYYCPCVVDSGWWRRHVAWLVSLGKFKTIERTLELFKQWPVALKKRWDFGFIFHSWAVSLILSCYLLLLVSLSNSIFISCLFFLTFGYVCGGICTCLNLLCVLLLLLFSVSFFCILYFQCTILNTIKNTLVAVWSKTQ